MSHKEAEPQQTSLGGRGGTDEPASRHPPEPTKEARLCLDLSYPSSIEAIDMLRGAGFKVSATGVSGFSDPELQVGKATYRGLKAIKRLVDDLKNGSP